MPDSIREAHAGHYFGSRKDIGRGSPGGSGMSDKPAPDAQRPDWLTDSKQMAALKRTESWAKPRVRQDAPGGMAPAQIESGDFVYQRLHGQWRIVYHGSYGNTSGFQTADYAQYTGTAPGRAPSSLPVSAGVSKALDALLAGQPISEARAGSRPAYVTELLAEEAMQPAYVIEALADDTFGEAHAGHFFGAWDRSKAQPAFGNKAYGHDPASGPVRHLYPDVGQGDALPPDVQARHDAVIAGHLGERVTAVEPGYGLHVTTDMHGMPTVRNGSKYYYRRPDGGWILGMRENYPTSSGYSLHATPVSPETAAQLEAAWRKAGMREADMREADDCPECRGLIEEAHAGHYFGAWDKEDAHPMEVHSHHDFATGQTIRHSHPGGTWAAHPGTGPATADIDKNDWMAQTGLRGGGTKRFTKRPTGPQYDGQGSTPPARQARPGGLSPFQRADQARRQARQSRFGESHAGHFFGAWPRNPRSGGTPAGYTTMWDNSIPHPWGQSKPPSKDPVERVREYRSLANVDPDDLHRALDALTRSGGDAPLRARIAAELERRTHVKPALPA